MQGLLLILVNSNVIYLFILVRHCIVLSKVTNVYSYPYIFLREHPFNLKGGLWFFWGKNCCLQIWLRKKILSLKWSEKNILLVLFALKNIIVFVVISEIHRHYTWDSELQNILPSHVTPVVPGLQVHSKSGCDAIFIQLPPFIHGFGLQLSAEII